MDLQLFQSIKSKHYKWNRIQCFRFADRFVRIISSKYPKGIPESEYFVLPGYESMTRFQPIVIFDPLTATFILSSNTVFFTPSNLIKD
jgi:hypothetical protein